MGVYDTFGKIIQAILALIFSALGLDNNDPSSCTVNGPILPTSTNTVVRFVAFGDTPYDGTSSPPLYMGTQYECLKYTMIPGIVNDYADSIDFVVHIGDIKEGSTSFANACNAALYTNRRDLFHAFETNEIDFLLLPGDNEWNECTGYDTDPTVPDTAKTLWRQYFAQGTYTNFDHTPLPFGGNTVTIERDSLQAQNFFFYYHQSQIAFFGITEPAGDSNYNPINAAFVRSKLSGIATSSPPKAIVMFGHSMMSRQVRDVLPQTIPVLYVTGSLHEFCAAGMNDTNSHPNSLSVTVAALTTAPLLLSVVKNENGDAYAFHYESTPHGCSS